MGTANVGILQKVRHVGEMVKFSHSIFALPFALTSMLVAAHGLPSARVFLLIVAAMITGRNAGMAFNRYLDANIDGRNPRTRSRHIPAGIISRRFALGFSAVNSVLFILICFGINTLTFLLSFPALILLFFYSATKRWTYLSHLVLGLALGISPLGAWIAVHGDVALPPIVLAMAVLFWVAGFDILYATQDHDFDRQEGLHSLVVRFGIARSLTLSRISHVASFVFLLAFGVASHLRWPYFGVLGLIALLFLYEHSLVKPYDLTRVNAAFFNVNGFISLLFLLGVALSI